MFSGRSQRRRAVSLHLISKPCFIPFRLYTATRCGEKNFVAAATHSFSNSSGLFFHFCLEQLISPNLGRGQEAHLVYPSSHKQKEGMTPLTPERQAATDPRKAQETCDIYFPLILMRYYRSQESYQRGPFKETQARSF